MGCCWSVLVSQFCFHDLSQFQQVEFHLSRPRIPLNSNTEVHACCNAVRSTLLLLLPAFVLELITSASLNFPASDLQPISCYFCRLCESVLLSISCDGGVHCGSSRCICCCQHQQQLDPSCAEHYCACYLFRGKPLGSIVIVYRLVFVFVVCCTCAC